MTDMESCPRCGALPCDWTDNPHHPQPTGDVGVAFEKGAIDRITSQAATILALTAEVERLKAEWGKRMAEHTRAIVRAAHAEEDAERAREILRKGLDQAENGPPGYRIKFLSEAVLLALEQGAAIGKAET